MNTIPDPAGSPRTKEPLSEAAATSRMTTHTLFRIFILTVLGSFFIFQLDVNYVWLSAVLTAVSIALGIVLLVRSAKARESRLILFGTISGLVVSAIMALLVMVSALFFTAITEYQDCARSALTQKAAAQCRVQLEEALPSQAR
ncbi:hypothetical protein V1639_01060 [Pseudarthrobacter sp. J75]|uniref:hypothetical protein n=1 Tax=unclassified Pseudarthrobacter TaxID=2647000 RepID=UPI002E80715C|nr:MULTISPECIES: hypothetical protein [unclassified Pseudarthrobacter]MEE2524554.1 hypothetical protein [Pseudarthrobacter sp. J47]MEE2527617.1 hypothetical protein [Pseudarthrobacter sp. J75]MEE2570718.1 hypothetical protein [Pseudarthrobacter sp. J64]